LPEALNLPKGLRLGVPEPERREKLMALEKPNPKLLKERLCRTEKCISKRRRLPYRLSHHRRKALSRLDCRGTCYHFFDAVHPIPEGADRNQQVL